MYTKRKKELLSELIKGIVIVFVSFMESFSAWVDAPPMWLFFKGGFDVGFTGCVSPRNSSDISGNKLHDYLWIMDHLWTYGID